MDSLPARPGELAFFSLSFFYRISFSLSPFFLLVLTHRALSSLTFSTLSVTFGGALILIPGAHLLYLLLPLVVRLLTPPFFMYLFQFTFCFVVLLLRRSLYVSTTCFDS